MLRRWSKMRFHRRPLPGFYGKPWTTPEPWRWTFDMLYLFARAGDWDNEVGAPPYGTWRRVAYDLANNLETWVTLKVRGDR